MINHLINLLIFLFVYLYNYLIYIYNKINIYNDSKFDNFTNSGGTEPLKLLYFNSLFYLFFFFFFKKKKNKK